MQTTKNRLDSHRITRNNENEKNDDVLILDIEPVLWFT